MEVSQGGKESDLRKVEKDQTQVERMKRIHQGSDELIKHLVV